MFLAVLILTLSVAMLFFYLQTICLKILRQEFDRDYFLPIVNANRLEFPSVRKAVEEFDAPVDYARFCMMLKCDFLALSYLLKNAANDSHRYSLQDRLLILYFHLTYFVLRLRHLLNFDMKTPLIRLISILQFFGNVVGLRVSSTSFRDISASDYLLTL
ncbi:MAG: hypothetical protein EPN47_06660 [Acidobacteria bacterium]|nr:MAG: hypothetical protein EPN47_06660 [Acidobacteriota bacterium]